MDNDNAHNTSASRSRQKRRQRQYLSWFDPNKNGSTGSCGSDVDSDEADAADGGCCFSPNDNNNNNNNNSMEEKEEQSGVDVRIGRTQGRRTQIITNDNHDHDDVNTNTNTTTTASSSKSSSSLLFRRQFFDTNGFWVARNFCSSSDSTNNGSCDNETKNETFHFKQAMSELVQHNWFPDNENDNENENNNDSDNDNGNNTGKDVV